ncbi:DUF3769 domain-containing protein [Trichothermofontia sichuanensis B231]|uniref:DUF3769 domain-containing protein n=1 Tax=Trichothermofontia sichuanensis TaxID=3045816 RepID=UPI0022475C6C|nr:DUF3769 domain-containing protein [Trichothermofontia sichuanensis]UZQ55917.1 DUF3769 domain-containing protein [Trichothermofontia sichuanensis B231]
MMYPALPPEPIAVMVLPSHQGVALEPPGTLGLSHRQPPTQAFSSQTRSLSLLEARTAGALASVMVSQVQPPHIRHSDGSPIPLLTLPGSVPFTPLPPRGIGDHSPLPLFYPAWAQSPPLEQGGSTAVVVPTVMSPVVTPSRQGKTLLRELMPPQPFPRAELAEMPQADTASASTSSTHPTTATLEPEIAPVAEALPTGSSQEHRAVSPPVHDDRPHPAMPAVTPLPPTTSAISPSTTLPSAPPAAVEQRRQTSQTDTVPILAPPTLETPQPRPLAPLVRPPSVPLPLRSEPEAGPGPLPQPGGAIAPPTVIEVPPPVRDSPHQPDATEPAIVPSPQRGSVAPDAAAAATAPTAEALEISSPDATAEDLLASPSDVVELTSDQQEYDEQRQIVTATGNVELRFRQSVLTADRLQVNLANRFIMAEGNVALRRGEQVLRGERFEYRFVQEEGTIFNANGEIFLPTAGTDFAFDAPAATGATGPQPLLSDRVLATQPLRVQRGPGDFQVGVGIGRDAPDMKRQGAVRRLRFEADQVDFNAFGWRAENVRVTNDPFAPAELELRTPEATLTHISPQADELITRRPRLVFDQGFSVPLLRERTILSKEPREPGLVNIGYDQEERRGVYIERTFNVIARGPVRLRVTPQWLVQKAINEGPNPIEPALYGLIARLDGTLSPQTSVRGVANFASLDFDDLADKLRASLRIQQDIGDHNLNLEYSYRDRLFNGSLGFQDVQSSLGVVLTSPNISLGEDGPRLNYQVGAQVVNAKTDQIDLLDPGQIEGLVALGRYQATAGLSQRLPLWQGKPLPPTATEGLRYSPVPIVPFVRLVAGMRGILTSYTSGDFQNALTGSLALEGQFGKFSRDFFDYTAFNVRYSQSLRDGESPFKFDRIEDRRVLAFSLSQQVYGPLRFGFQTAVNLDKEDRITTDYILEYSRRTYGVVLRFNPVLQIGSINLRISDFNWNGNPEPFPDMNVRPVSDGVVP